jgi:O-methyltransferase
VRATHLAQLARRVVKHLPIGAQRWLEAREVDYRVRAGKTAGPLPEGALVPVRQLERKYRQALLLLSERQGREKLGDYLEFGVYAGASLACMHRVTHDLGLTHVRLFGFDSFEGLPASDEQYSGTKWQPGDFAYDEEAARAYLTGQGVRWDRVILTKGWFDESLTPELAQAHSLVKASVIMVDSDLYSSARTALEFCAPLIRDEAVVFFDDWWPESLGANGMGEKRAFDEFLESHPVFTATELASYYPKAAKVFLVSRSSVSQPAGGDS